MHLELTQILVCPHCGPPNGLIAFVDRMEERRIVEGRLDCPVCERRHAVRGGRVLLGNAAVSEDATDRDATDEAATGEDAASTAAALLGRPEGPEVLLLCGGAPSIAPAIAELRPEAALVAFGSAVIGAHPRVYPVVPPGDGGHLPFRPGSFSGAVLTGDRADLVPDVAPALAAGARLVVLVPGGAGSGLAVPSLRELASDARAWVGVRA